MGESFENSDTILRDWAKDKVQNILVEELNRYPKQEEERENRFLFRKWLRKILEQSQSAVERDQTKRKTRLSKPRTINYLEFNKPNKQNVYQINLFKKFNFSQSQNNCWHTDWRQSMTS